MTKYYFGRFFEKIFEYQLDYTSLEFIIVLSATEFFTLDVVQRHNQVHCSHFIGRDALLKSTRVGKKIKWEGILLRKGMGKGWSGEVRN